MFIYHFNRMIRSKLLWLIIAVITVFAFVFAGYIGSDGRSGSSGKDGAVDDRELARQEMFVRGPGRTRSGLPYAVVQSQAWERVIALRTAREMGIVTGVEEVRAAIRATPDFRDSTGNFSRQIYLGTMRQLEGWTPALFEQYVADQLTLGKLQALVGAASWVSPLEMQGEYDSWTDMLTVRTAIVTNTVDAAAIELSEEDLRAFYDEDPTRYDLPAQVRVRYAEQTVTNYLPSVTVTEEAIANYYDDNTGDFTRMGTNNVRETIPLEEVTDRIRDIIALDEARYIASTNAVNGFLAYVRDKSEGIFDKFAADNGMNIVTTELFAASDYLPGIDVGALAEFRDTAFDLDPERNDSRCGVAVGGTHSYLISAITNLPPRTPEFEEVRARVEADARFDARRKAFAEMLEKAEADVRAALAEGKDFADAVAAAGTSVGDPIPAFSLVSMPRSAFDPAGLAMARLRTLPAGEMTEPVPVANGALLIFLDKREAKETPVDADAIADYSVLRNQFRSMLGGARRSAGFEDWMAGNLAGSGFAPQVQSEPSESDDDEGEE